MKKILAALAALALAFAMMLPLAAEEAEEGSGEVAGVDVRQDFEWDRLAGEDITINVYNWGEYIADGLNGLQMDVNAEFEALTGIKVNLTTFDTNEGLYSKLKSGGADYDVIFASDYMIGKMINEDMLAKLDFANIPNYENIGQQYRGLDFDPADEYSVPYTWGYVGIVYNTTMVDEVPDSWDVLWDEKYAGDILMFDNSRDAFAIALKRLGMSMNPSSVEEIELAAEELAKQKDIVQGYVMDQIFDKMGGSEAAIAPYYAGDVIVIQQDNPDLAFAWPKEGTNFFVDSACVPATSKNQEAAELYINFLCEPAVAVDNAVFIGYATPNVVAEEMLPDELRNNPIAYPPAEVLENTEVFNVLPDELNEAMDKAWSDMRGGNAGVSSWVIIVALALAVVLAVVIIWRRSVKKRRDNY